jgi:hypothetical protein
MVDVVDEPDGDAALRRARERVVDDLLEAVRQAEVVDRDLEGLAGRRDELGEGVRGVLRGLAAVGQRAELYRAAF